MIVQKVYFGANETLPREPEIIALQNVYDSITNELIGAYVFFKTNQNEVIPGVNTLPLTKKDVSLLDKAGYNVNENTGVISASNATSKGLPLGLSTKDLEFATSVLLILVGLGLITGATFLELTQIAIVVAIGYLLFEGVKAVKEFFDNALDNIIPKSLKEWLDKNFPGGYAMFKILIEAALLSLVGYKVVKHYNKNNKNEVTKRRSGKY